MTTFIFSIRPVFAYRVFTGRKKYELRRYGGFRVETGDRIILYVSGRVQAVMGEFQAGEVLTGPPEAVWKKIMGMKDTGITGDLYRYIAGSKTAMAIEVRNPLMYRYPAKLDDLRRIFPGFNPPLSMLPLDDADPLVVMVFNKLRDLTTQEPSVEDEAPAAKTEKE